MLTRDRHPCSRCDWNPQSKKPNDPKPTPYTVRPLGSAVLIFRQVNSVLIAHEFSNLQTWLCTVFLCVSHRREPLQVRSTVHHFVACVFSVVVVGCWFLICQADGPSSVVFSPLLTLFIRIFWAFFSRNMTIRVP